MRERINMNFTTEGKSLSKSIRKQADPESRRDVK